MNQPPPTTDSPAASRWRATPLARTFIHRVLATVLSHPDGTDERSYAPAVWTLAHRGYSGAGRLDVWVYPSKAAATYAGAQLAMAAGLDDDDRACALFAAHHYHGVLDRYEHLHPDTHLLRVQPAFLHPATEPGPDERRES